MRKFGLPMLVLGGGGYTLSNVSRCWTLDTATLIGDDCLRGLPHEVPQHEPYRWYYGPQHTLRLGCTRRKNQNTTASLQVGETLRS